jgi:hypothetical protein
MTSSDCCILKVADDLVEYAGVAAEGRLLIALVNELCKLVLL